MKHLNFIQITWKTIGFRTVFFVKQLETAGFRVVKLMEILTSPSPRDNVRQVVSAPHLERGDWSRESILIPEVGSMQDEKLKYIFSK